MGLRDRLRIQRIKLGFEETRSGKSEYTVEKTRIVVTTKCPDITTLTEIKTCRQIMRMLRMPKMPQHIIREKTKEGMYKVVAKLEKAGETRENIFKFYWGIPEFQELWGEFGYTEQDWQDILGLRKVVEK